MKAFQCIELCFLHPTSIPHSQTWLCGHIFYKRPFSFKFFFLQAWHTGQKFFGEVLQTFSNYLPSACLTLSLLIRHCRLTVVQSRRLMRSSAETYVITQAVRKGLAHTHALNGALMDNSICCVGLFFQFHFFCTVYYKSILDLFAYKAIYVQLNSTTRLDTYFMLVCKQRCEYFVNAL